MSTGAVPVLRATSPWSLSTFCEGPRTLNEKITGVVVAVLAAIASFFLLPKAAALLLTGALAVLCATFCSANGLEGSLAQEGYALSNAISYIPTLIQPVLNSRAQLAPQIPSPAPYIAQHAIHSVNVHGRVQPVLNPGAREIAGTGQHQSNVDPQRLQRMQIHPWRYGLSENGVPQPQPAGNQPRAPVGH